MTGRSKTCVLAAALLAGASALAIQAGPAAAQAKGPFKIGTLYTMTGNGAPYGRDTMIGNNMAVKEINAMGGIMGRQIQVVEADDQGDPTHGVNEAKRLAYEAKVDAIVGPFFSTVAQAVAPTLDQASIIYIGEAGAQSLTPQSAPTYFSLQMTAEDQGLMQADYAKANGAKSIAIVGDNGAISRTIADGAKKRAAEIGLKVSGYQEFTFGDTDMTPQVLNLRRGNPDMLLVNAASQADATHLLKNIGEVNWNIPMTSGTTFGSQYPRIAPNVPPAVAANMKSGIDLKAFTYCPGDPLGQSLYSKTMAKLKAFAPNEFEKAGPQNMIWGYDAVFTVKIVAEGAGTSDGKKMTAWLEQNASKVTLVEGTLSASKDRHFLGNPDTYVMVEKLGDRRSDGLRMRAGCKKA